MNDFQILKVENGWIVLEGNFNDQGFYKKKWVAPSVEALKELVGQIADEKFDEKKVN